MRCKLEAIGGTMGWAQTTLMPLNLVAARYNTWRLMKLTPTGAVFSFVFETSICYLVHAPSACWPADASHVRMSCLDSWPAALSSDLASGLS